MATCIQIGSTIVGQIEMVSERCGSIGIASLWKNCMDVASRRIGAIDLFSLKIGRIAVSSSFVCEVSRLIPYLEIQPTTVWLLDWGAINEVFSNTKWKVD